nr:hypothetical protein [Tanacetum cinerariifolium]
MTVVITTEDMQKRINDVNARTTLLLALPDEHQLRFNKYETAQELWGAILKAFGGNEATKKTKKNQLKQQYNNFKAEGSETLKQTFNRLQAIVSHLEFIDVEIEQDDLNQKFLTSLALEWLMYTIKVYEPEVQKKSESNSQNITFISSAYTSNGKGEIKYEDITQIDEDDIKEMDIKWNMALLKCFNCHKMGYFARECRAPRSQDRGRRESNKQGSKEEESAPKALMAIDGIRWDWSYMANEEENHALLADDEAPTEFALIAKSSSSSKNERTDKNKEDLGYNVVPPTPPAQVYSPPNKYMSWTRLPKFANDTITDYSRPSPGIESNISDLQNSNSSISEHGESSSSIMSKPMIKFVKAANSPTVIKTNKVETARKSSVKYAEMYRNASKSPNDSGCSQHMTDNISYLSKYEPYDGGYVSFGQGGGKITDFFLRTKDKTSGILRNFITEIENLKYLKVKIIRYDNGGEFKNKEMNEFCTRKDIKREFSNAKTPQQNEVAERRNKTLIEAARTMLADDKLHVTFWAEVVNTACYVQNKVLLNKFQNKTPYELFNSRTPSIGFLRQFGCHVMILNTLDHLGEFKAKGDEGYFVGYSMSSKAFRVFNKRTKRVEENLHVDFLENKLIEKGAGPNWLFDIDTLTNSMNYVSVVVAGTSSTNISAHMESSNSDAQDACNADVFESNEISNPTATSKIPAADQMESLTVESVIPTVSSHVLTACLDNSPETTSDSRLILKGEEPKKIYDALKDLSWVEAMQEELLQFKIKNVWILVDCPKGIRPIGTKWVLKNKKDERRIVIRNKARLVAQGHTQEADINYEEVFAPVERIEAIRLFLTYASFMGFTVYQMDVKSAFLYDTIDEEVYVMQPPGFQDPEFPDRVYKVEKVMYGLHQASRAWSANTPMDKENPWGKDEPGKDVELHMYRSMIGSLMYLTASRPDIMFDVCACARHQVTPKECHLYVVKRIFIYLKGHPKLGLRYPKESLFDLVAYSDSDYGGATQDRKSTTRGCQFLWRRLFSWQCIKQTIVATSTTKVEYVAAASGCRQVLWIQNQMLDYGLAFSDYHNMIAILEKSKHNIDFHQIVDFIEASHIRFALTINPTVYVSHIQQFWSTTRIKTTNEGTKILATVDGKPRTISESSIRRNIKLNDEEGISSLPDAELFENLTLMGYNILPNQRFTFQKDEPASLLRNDSQGEAFPTVSGLDAGQDRENNNKTSPLSHESTPRVTSLDADEGNKDRGNVEPSGDDAPIKGKSMETGEEVRVERSTELGSNDTEEMVNVLTSIEAANILTSGVVAVSVPSVARVSTVGVLTVSGIFPTVSAIFTTASVVTPYSRRPRGISAKDKVAREMKEEIAKEDQRINEQLARDAEIARIHAEEELKMLIDGMDRSNEVIAKHLQEYEQSEAELTIGEKIDLINELVKYQDHHAKILKYQAQKSSHSLRKNKGNSTYFVPMSSTEEAERVKRKGLKLDQRSSKRMKTSEEEMHSEGKKDYWKIIRLGGHTVFYQFFVDMLKQLDREDLHQLWALVKETLSIRHALRDKEKELWVELKGLFEPDFEDQLWTHNQNLMHDPLDWKLYDTCGVHHVFTKDQKIFMLVERDYPLRRGLTIMMISNKLQVKNYSQMANDLILKIHNITNSPR